MSEVTFCARCAARELDPLCESCAEMVMREIEAQIWEQHPHFELIDGHGETDALVSSQLPYGCPRCGMSFRDLGEAENHTCRSDH